MKDEQLWDNLCAVEGAFYDARMALFRNVQNLEGLVQKALDIPSERGTALRLLKIVPIDSVKRHFSCLINLVSVGHSDVALCRQVILRIDRDWLIDNIELHVSKVLRQGNDEEYRRIAELYQQLDDGLLDAHVRRCLLHKDIDVREVGSDFERSSGDEPRVLAGC